MLMSRAHVARIRDVRNTAKIQKYKSTERRGLTALTGVAWQREKLLLKRARRPIVPRRKGNHLCRYCNKKVIFALGFLQIYTNVACKLLCLFSSVNPSINLSIYLYQKFTKDDRSSSFLTIFSFFTSTTLSIAVRKPQLIFLCILLILNEIS